MIIFLAMTPERGPDQTSPETKPDWKTWKTVVVGGKSSQVLEREIKRKSVNVSEYALEMMKDEGFVTLKHPEQINFVLLKVEDLGFANLAGTDQIFKRAQKLGLDLCPPEAAAALRLEYDDQPWGERLYVGMKQITVDKYSHPCIFELARIKEGLWLYDDWAMPDAPWGPKKSFIFRLPENSPQR